jgi:DNA-binding MarR family transcriptional regulator
MDPSTQPRGSRAPDEAVRELRAVLEAVKLLWEQADDAEAPVIVSASQLRVLCALERGPGLNLRELGESIGSAPSALSRLCARLEAMGFVRRSPSTQSGREIELYLTHHADSEHHCDYGPVLPIARQLREQIDWPELRAELDERPMADAFFYLLERLDVIEPAADHVSGPTDAAHHAEARIEEGGAR